MADYETRVEKVERTTLVLKSPTNWAEVDKAKAAALGYLRRWGVEPSDDAVQVEAFDDEILIKLPERDLDAQVGRVEAAHVADDAISGLVQYAISVTGMVGGPTTAEDLVKLLRKYDPKDPPFGVAARR